MKIGFKKIAAFLTAAAIVTTLSGCEDNGYIMEVDGMPIRTGIYISLQQNAMNNAFEELRGIIGTDADYVEDVFTQSINGKSYSDWVKDDTARAVKRFVGVKRLCEQYNITLSDDEKAKINKDVQENWDMSETTMDFYGQNYTVSFMDMYGFETMGDYYESQGIGIDSLKEIAYTDALNDKLFMHYYGVGGEFAVPDEEIEEYLEENSVAYRLLTINYVDYLGYPVVGEEQDAIIDLARSYAEKYNEEENVKWIDILYDYDLYKARNAAKKTAEEEYKADPPEGVTYEEYIEEAMSEATATKYDNDDMFDEIVFIENDILSAELMEYILDAPEDGTAAAYDGSTAVYVIIRNPVKNFPAWKADNFNNIIKELRGEEFDSRMELLSQNYDIVQKDKLVNGKYSPEKLNK